MSDDKTRVLTGDPNAAGTAAAQDAHGRVGAYRLVSLLGKGGMGEVWLAERADDAYSKRVAIKFISSFMGNREAIDWFRRERQALARLEHPKIARLLDGGETQDGRPYLVMEYVDGIPIDDYCQRLPLEAVLDLFLQVCAAVEHAHRALIVHRDIKPANVLVTADGQARLLDFGIAKEMEQSPADKQPLTTTQAYTLHYASPEQMEGRAITVASDIYSLGALLYRLLSGQVPHAEATSALGQLQAINTSQPQKPSRIALEQPGVPELERRRRSRKLHGDLDDIALKCLRREAELRYGSVGDLIDDIQRYRTHQPVLARRGTIGYRVSRYLRRHWLAIGAAAALLMTLAGGLVATYWQAQLAERQRALAQKRFELSRALVNDVLFDFQDRLANVSGTIEVRRRLVDRTNRYLQQIARDAQDEPGMLIDLSRVERRLGDITGNPNDPNIGDTPAAGRHYQRAVDLARRASKLRPGDAPARLALALALNSQATFLFWNNQLDRAGKIYGESAVLLESMVASAPSESLEREWSRAVIGLGDVHFWKSELPQALAAYDRACRKILANPSKAFEVRDAAGTCHIRRADALAWSERYGEAEAEIAKAVVIYDSLLAKEPENLNLGHSYSVALTKQGEIFSWNNKLDQALQVFTRALDLAARQSAADPEDLRALRDLALTHNKRGDALLETRRFDQAITSYRAGREINLKLLQMDPAQAERERDVAISNHRVGMALVKSGKADQAIPYFDAQLETTRRRWRKAPTEAWARRDLAVALQDRIEAPASAAQLCAWHAEVRDLMLALKRDGVASPTDQDELDKSVARLQSCPAAAGGADLPGSATVD